MTSLCRTSTIWVAMSVALALGCSGDDGANGAAGADGMSALVNTTSEPAGTNCAAGGIRVEAGIDADADGVLDAAEVTSTQYVCDGAGGAAGAPGATALVDVTPEAAGANCAVGGTRIDSGLDADADGVLDAAEVTGTRYVCDGAGGAAGAPGANALVVVTPEAAGATCTNGGTRIDSGLDADADGVLDAAEVTSTQYVCDGADGATGAPGAVALVTLTPEAAGPSCAHGGTRIDSGLDADADGVLDPSEVTSTQYVCTPDVADPAVVSVDPAPGEISNGGTFVVTFSEAMDPATIDGTSVYLVLQWDYDGFLVDAEVVPATVTYDDATHTATLVSTDSLEPFNPYALHVTGHARDLQGGSLPDFVASYWVATDGAAPRVVSVTPVDGGVVGPSPTVALTFDEGLNSDSGNLARIELVDGSGAPVPGSSWWDGSNGVYFSPDAPLAAGQTYTASIDAVVADWSGNWDHLTMSLSFSVDASTLPAMTGPPVVSPASQIAGGAIEVTIPVNAPARYAEVYVGDDVSGWNAHLVTLDGNWNGEGRIIGTGNVPYPPASGSYSIWVFVYDGGWSASSVYVADSSISTANYTTWDSSDGTVRESTIPLAFLEVGEPVFVDLSATIDFVPGTGGAGDVNYTIRNTGTGAAGPFVAGVYVNPASPPALYQVPDYWLDVTGLAAGAEVTGTIPVSGLPEIVTRVHALVDLTASIPEWDDGNNLATDVHRWGTGTSYPNTTPVPILDNAWANSPLDVSAGPTSIADATVTLSIIHTWVNDLGVYLVSPGGTWVTLVADRGGSDDNFTGTVFDDAAAAGIWEGAPPFTGTFRPEQPLGTLAGGDANGTWTLAVYDHAAGDIGTIDSWTLTLW